MKKELKKAGISLRNIILFLVIPVIIISIILLFSINPDKITDKMTNVFNEQDEQLVGGDKDVKELNETLKQECINLGCPPDSLFAGSKNSDKYYNCDCRWAKNIILENLICFSSDNEALADGRVKSEC
jgi:hypothetical protein